MRDTREDARRIAERHEALAKAERMGLNARCSACGAEPGEGCRGEDGLPQSAYTHNVRLGVRR